jgi:hypothetical protein
MDQYQSLDLQLNYGLDVFDFQFRNLETMK